MKNLELNKIAASILLAGLIAMFSGKIADVLYHPVTEPEKRGFQVEVAEAGADASGAAAEEAAPLDIPALMAAANTANGQNIFKKCTACHSSDAGKHGVGPSLSGAYGAKKAHYADYNYSDAMKAKAGNWDEAALFAFLHKPREYVPGTKMGFAGIKKPEEIADLVAYLKTLK